MKKFVLMGVLAISFFTLTGVNAQNAIEKPRPKGQATINAAASFTTEIDGIAVPVEVLVYINKEYLGHAVTHAEKVTIGSKKFYKLHIERDIKDNDRTNLYLIYTLKWELVDEKKTTTPAPRPKPARPEKPKSTQDTGSSETVQNETSTTEDTAPNETTQNEEDSSPNESANDSEDTESVPEENTEEDPQPEEPTETSEEESTDNQTSSEQEPSSN